MAENIPTVIYFVSDLVSLHFILWCLAAFQDLKSAIFCVKSGPLARFKRLDFGCNFSFSKLFLNNARYTLSAISKTNFFTPINVRFFWFLLCFVNFELFFGQLLGTAVKNTNHKKVVPGNYLNKKKSLKCVFPRCKFSGPQLSRRGLVWNFLNSSKTHAPCGHPRFARA